MFVIPSMIDFCCCLGVRGDIKLNWDSGVKMKEGTRNEMIFHSSFTAFPSELALLVSLLVSASAEYSKMLGDIGVLFWMILEV